MDREHYKDIIYSPSNNAYTFSSVGTHGVILKVIIFQALSAADSFNLFLTDLVDGRLADDLQVTDNGDLPKVMATVVAVIRDFTIRQPEARIIISGSNDTRKRLYARIIQNNFESLIREYDVYFTDGIGLAYKSFDTSDQAIIPYAFLINRKKLNLNP